MRMLAGLALILALAGCSIAPEERLEEPETLALAPVSFDDLPGWADDDLADLDRALDRSCARIAPQPDDRPLGRLPRAGTVGDWKPICDSLRGRTGEALRDGIETYLRPYRASLSSGGRTGLFTGYYEAQLNGSRTPSERYATPLLKRPDDLVSVSLGEFREDFAGERIAGKVVDGRLRPYETRAEIVEGALDGRSEPLVWVDDPVDAFFLQVQGSGRVALNDGTTMRVGYAAANGQPYYAIGRELVARGDLTLEAVSLQSIRAWAEANPEAVPDLLNTNRSYIFFREIEGEGPIGAQGAPLTPRRSIAVDRRHIPLGIPLWVDIDHPESDGGALRRLMVAQDIGGAIRGPVRGDFFWGHGPEAEALAGTMKADGRYYLLLPKGPEGIRLSLN